jgi:hypothetical protein
MFGVNVAALDWKGLHLIAGALNPLIIANFRCFNASAVTVLLSTLFYFV